MMYNDYIYINIWLKYMKIQDVDLFRYSDYKLYLKDKFYTYPSHGHGIQAKVAEVCGCNPSYISQVLNGVPHLTLEQTVAISDWLGHNKLEGKYFLTLVQMSKAGSLALKKVFQEEAAELKQSSLNIKKRVRSDVDLTSEEQATYYSDWVYAGIHVALTIPSLRTVDTISNHFQISHKKVHKILKFLDSVNLAKREGDQYLPTMHYSTVVSLSRKDFEKLHGTLLKVIEEFQAVVKPSPEEELASFNMDFFKV
jgi:uncharacterized protein (TIGR02147 family)